MEASSGGKPHDFLEPPAHAVAFDSAAHLLGNGKPDPYRTAVATAALLHNKPRRRNMGSGGCSNKIVPSPQSFHCTDILLSARRLLCAKPLAATRSTRIDHLTPAVGRHAGSEAMTALAHQLARLISALHGFPLEVSVVRLSIMRIAARPARQPPAGTKDCGGLYGRAFDTSMQSQLRRYVAVAVQASAHSWEPRGGVPRTRPRSRLKLHCSPSSPVYSEGPGV